MATEAISALKCGSGDGGVPAGNTTYNTQSGGLSPVDELKLADNFKFKDKSKVHGAIYA